LTVATTDTLGLFRALCPDLCTEEDGRIGVFLAAAARRLDPSAWGAVYVDALIYLAAHLLLRSPASGSGGANVDASGPVTSKRAGDLAVTYAASAVAGGSGGANIDRDLAETHYGRQFLALRDTRAAGLPFFAVGG
jgi:hypothetical protein